MNGNWRHIVIRLIFALSAVSAARAQEEALEPNDIDLTSATIVNLGSGQFAPSYISALQHGKITQSKGLMLDVGLAHKLDTLRRFSWGAAVEVIGGVTSSAEYLKYNEDGSTFTHSIRPAAVRLQQLYGEVKWRSLFLTAGMKSHESYLLDNTLTSGDLIESGNARPIPELRVGFIDFQNIPLTRGWVQIQGELAYGKFVDNGWLRDFYSYGTGHINTGAFYIYRRLYLRSKPSERLVFTFGMQAAGQIGGTSQWWHRGRLVLEESEGASFGKLLGMIIPVKMSTGVGEYFDGNNLGSWDFLLRYHIPHTDHELKAYLQKPWEKGSSVGWHNGWDGLWGIEYSFGAKAAPVEAVLVEYLNFMNQSGPIHFAPHDSPGTTITTNASGRDDYYNNAAYNSYMNYGLGIGSPFLKSPYFNTDGYPAYADNLVRGFHIGARGHIVDGWRWRLLAGYKEAYGNAMYPRATPLDDFSWLAEVEATFKGIRPLRLKLQVAMDHGELLGNNFGIALTGSYKGDLNFRRK